MNDDAAAVLAKLQGHLTLGVLELSHAAAEALAQHAGGSLQLPRLRVLTVGAAKALAKHQGGLGLGIEQLSRAAAEALAEHAGGSLGFSRLKFLNEGAAKALAFHKGSQYMAHEDLTTLSIGFNFKTPFDLGASKALAHLRAAKLTLRLAKGAAKALARGGTGRLSLSVGDLSDEEAESLAQLEHLLRLPRLKALTNTNLARKLVHSKNGENDEMWSNDLKSLSNEVATVLTRLPDGCLYLDSLGAISDEIAETFAKALETGALGHLRISDKTPCSPHARRILLLAGGFETDTLTELDVDFAKAVASRQRTFFFNGLSELSLQAAKALGEHDGDLTLEGLKSLTEDAAAALANHKGRLFFNLPDLSQEAAEQLRNAKGEICGQICGQEANEFLQWYLQWLSEQPRPEVESAVYLRRVWADVDGALDLRVSYRTAEETVYALVQAIDYARAEPDDLGGSLKDFYAEAVDRARGMNSSLGGSLRDFFLTKEADSDGYVTVDQFEPQEPVTPVCDDFEVVVDEADRIHFLPFQLQTVMSAEEWSVVSSLWRPWLANAPLDEANRMGWQVCLTKAEFLGQPG